MGRQVVSWIAELTKDDRFCSFPGGITIGFIGEWVRQIMTGLLNLLKDDSSFYFRLMRHPR
jgi:hypothetical protein